MRLAGIPSEPRFSLFLSHFNWGFSPFSQDLTLNSSLQLRFSLKCPALFTYLPSKGCNLFPLWIHRLQLQLVPFFIALGVICVIRQPTEQAFTPVLPMFSASYLLSGIFSLLKAGRFNSPSLEFGAWFQIQKTGSQRIKVEIEQAVSK